MPNYEKMYHKLFNAVTDVINVLQKARLESEEEYINSDGENKSMAFCATTSDISENE